MTNTTQKTENETEKERYIALNGKWIDIDSLSKWDQKVIRRGLGEDGGLSDYDLEEVFEEMLNDCYPETEIGYSVFYAGEILKNCDPIQFRIGAEEYNDSRAEDIVFEAVEVDVSEVFKNEQ